MDSAVARVDIGVARRAAGLQRLFAHERVLLLFLIVMAVLGAVRPLSSAQRVLLWSMPVTLYLLWSFESGASRAWSRMARQWTSFGLILVAYWSLELFAATPISHWQDSWISWDRVLLHDLGLKALIEAAGRPAPFLLEALYLLLYAIPPISLAILYFSGARSRSGNYLLVLFLGTLTAYALIPFFPVASPRDVYPGTDLPSFGSIPRSINVWLLDHMDITTGVFPSGHVAVAFSSAFGLLYAVPARRKLWLAAFFAAALVYIATIYGRYHYAVDGLASIAISAVAWRLSMRVGSR